MAMQLRCRCGANLSVDAGTQSIVCGACGATVAVPQPERELALSDTVLALPTVTAPAPPAPKRRSSWPIVVGAIAVVAAGIALVVIATRDSSTAAKPAPVAKPVVPVVDAAPSEPPPTASSPEELVVLERAAIGRADEAAILALISPTVFAHGIDASEIAYASKQAAPIIRSIGGTIVTSTWSKIVRDKDVAWIVDELDAGGEKILTSQLAFRYGTAWRVAAWHAARLVPNKQAYLAAKDFRLPEPIAVTEQFDDDHQVHDAFRAAFATREAFIAAFSERADAIDLGSAPGERIIGGVAVKRSFAKIGATFGLREGVAAGRVNDRVGWAAGNVDFTMTIEDEDIRQTFRVLAVLVREGAGWRIVLAQWSNAGPVP